MADAGRLAATFPRAAVRGPARETALTDEHPGGRGLRVVDRLEHQERPVPRLGDGADLVGRDLEAAESSIPDDEPAQSPRIPQG